MIHGTIDDFLVNNDVVYDSIKDRLINEYNREINSYVPVETELSQNTTTESGGDFTNEYSSINASAGSGISKYIPVLGILAAAGFVAYRKNWIG